MSVELGEFSRLEVVKQVDLGMYLDGGEEGEILLPTRYVSEDCKVGDWLNIFLYLDSEERLIATTLTPLVQAGEFACLKASWVSQFGAFFNQGLMEDLPVPFSERKMKVQVGNRYAIHTYIDDENFRIIASAKVDRYLSRERAPCQPGEKVNILIWQKTDLGFRAIIEDVYSGLLYDSGVSQTLHTDDMLKAYIKQVRKDGKIDLILQKSSFKKVDDFPKTLYRYIADHGGRIGLNDKSPAEEIYDVFGVSKKTFKKAVDDLYKEYLILLHEDGIELIRP